MATPTAISAGNSLRYSTFLQVHAGPVTDDERAYFQWQVYTSYEAVQAASLQGTVTAAANPGLIPGALLATPPCPHPASAAAALQSTILTAQHTFSASQKASHRANQISYTQRFNDLNTAITAHSTHISLLKNQLSILSAQHSIEHTHFDSLDAVDLAAELDSRSGPSSSALLARATREAKRTANAAVVTSIATEIAAQFNLIAAAHTTFETQIQRLILSSAKTSLRALKELKAVRGAKVPKGEHKVAFWNAVKRAVKVKAPAKKDVQCLEEYKDELRGPMLGMGSRGVASGMPPAPEVVDMWPELGEERDGLFSTSGWQ